MRKWHFWKTQRHFGGTVQWTLSLVALGKKNPPGWRGPTCPTRQTANTLMLLWYYHHSRHTLQHSQSVINVLSELYFLSDQRWRGNRVLKAKHGYMFGCERQRTLLSKSMWTFCVHTFVSEPVCFMLCCFVDCADTSQTPITRERQQRNDLTPAAPSCTKLIYKSSSAGASGTTQTGCYKQLITVSFVGILHGKGFKCNISQLIWPFQSTTPRSTREQHASSS